LFRPYPQSKFRRRQNNVILLNKVKLQLGITLKPFAGKIPGVKFNESELRADFPNGARITILGAENDQALRGIFLDGCVLDETQSIAPNLFPEIIRPSLADRKGWCVFIGTPKGKNYFFELYQYAQKTEGWYSSIT
jgi:phage terminase large subunit